HTMILQGDYPALVMTSGNTTDEPIENENESALTRLSGIADAFLLHNRDIYTRCDDSVLKVFQNEPFMIRRARGYIPCPLTVQRRADYDIIAVGAELKNTITYIKSDQAYTSQHLGSLTDASTYESFQQTIKKLGALIESKPAVIACDLHPAMLSTRFAEQYSDVRIVRVQHHHAHIASVMGEYNLTGPILGFSADGLGYGADGTIWGGELMMVWRDRFERRGFLEQVPMPGGDAASKQPWRMALSYLIYAFGPDQGTQLAAELMPDLKTEQVNAVAEMIAKGINSPMTSSCGRLFDAVSALNQICYINTYDAQAAIELENHARPDLPDQYPIDLIENNDTTILSVSPIIKALVHDIQNGTTLPNIAARFHNSIAAGFADMIHHLSIQSNIDTVALAGGAFQNEVLLNRLVTILDNLRLKVYFNRKLPINDGSISFGQAIVADATMSQKNNT
ncbi:MAG: carbamoyltransferase HypF, partial [Planctomycetes bacterium]|nr:carbamoyltransferase HypF [Planctomycetota bacterium]